MSVEIGSILAGKVVSIMPFGAFVSLPDGKNGLVHISEVAANYVKDINEHLKQGDSVNVKVLKIDDKGKISLSIKKAIIEEKKTTYLEPRKVRPADVEWINRNNNVELSFEDKLNKFKQDSDDKIKTLKRSAESKRSGGYHRGGGSY